MSEIRYAIRCSTEEEARECKEMWFPYFYVTSPNVEIKWISSTSYTIITYAEAKDMNLLNKEIEPKQEKPSESFYELWEKCSRLDHENRIKQGQVDSLNRELRLFKKLYYDLTKEDRHEKQETMESNIDIVEEIMKEVWKEADNEVWDWHIYIDTVESILRKHLSK